MNWQLYGYWVYMIPPAAPAQPCETSTVSGFGSLTLGGGKQASGEKYFKGT
jgi:hypothetical protein